MTSSNWPAITKLTSNAGKWPVRRLSASYCKQRSCNSCTGADGASAPAQQQEIWSAGYRSVSENILNDGLELVVGDDGFLLDTQRLHARQNLSHLVVWRIVDAHLFQTVGH